MGVVVVVPVVVVVSVVVVIVESVRADDGPEPANTDAARNPAAPRLRRTTAAATLRTVRSVALDTACSKGVAPRDGLHFPHGPSSTATGRARRPSDS